VRLLESLQASVWVGSECMGLGSLLASVLIPVVVLCAAAAIAYLAYR
jgi:hypothetical protein